MAALAKQINVNKTQRAEIVNLGVLGTAILWVWCASPYSVIVQPRALEKGPASEWGKRPAGIDDAIDYPCFERVRPVRA